VSDLQKKKKQRVVERIARIKGFWKKVDGKEGRIYRGGTDGSERAAGSGEAGRKKTVDLKRKPCLSEGRGGKRG